MASPYRAYIDDSGKGQDPVFVLAGFVATVSQWAAFGREWEAALNVLPAIEYFKMKEAAAREGQFRGWSEEKRNERLRILIDIIDRNVIAGIGSSIHQPAYRKVFRGKLARGTDSPYFLNFYGVMQTMFILQRQTGDHNPVDFIFDEQGKEVGRALRGWKYFVRDAPEAVKAMIGEPPVSADEKKVLPLQAADLLAWRIRRVLVDTGKGEDIAIRLLPFPETLGVLIDTWDEPRLEDQLLRAQALRVTTGHVFEYDLGRKDRRRMAKLMAREREEGES